ncbi:MULTISPECIES: SsrA-binding protein SmpB [unclassified Iodidimonas]|jgi:SsrA-binding protein|uniref:SsrA-binding protein SmpB n=1 Tax=unclassified Iodidimonas TaxID=2626145 RepID=UPI00248263AF|nr:MULTISPECIES: SsrA-binding protein SmpB [unclassified Iodidimonas]
MVKQDLNGRMVSENRKARYNYAVEDTYEAGIALKGTEVKALRKGTANIAESYAEEKNGEIWLINAHIDEFSHGNIHNHEPRRPRKLLLHRKQINKIAGAIQRAGMTLVPLKIYFNDRGRAKILLGLARGKKAHDKREDIKQRDWDRQKQRLLKDYG